MTETTVLQLQHRPTSPAARLRDMLEEQQSRRLSDNECETLMGDNTWKLYMAATRAAVRDYLYRGVADGAMGNSDFRLIQLSLDTVQCPVLINNVNNG
jgi:hypothetical protein